MLVNRIEACILCGMQPLVITCSFVAEKGIAITTIRFKEHKASSSGDYLWTKQVCKS